MKRSEEPIYSEGGKKGERRSWTEGKERKKERKRRDRERGALSLKASMLFFLFLRNIETKTYAFQSTGLSFLLVSFFTARLRLLSFFVPWFLCYQTNDFDYSARIRFFYKVAKFEAPALFTSRFNAPSAFLLFFLLMPKMASRQGPLARRPREACISDSCRLRISRRSIDDTTTCPSRRMKRKIYGRVVSPWSKYICIQARLLRQNENEKTFFEGIGKNEVEKIRTIVHGWGKRDFYLR